ncbi:MAG: hypothetical protein RLZZ553_914 [Verrucomicrobiota bacterium]
MALSDFSEAMRVLVALRRASLDAALDDSEILLLSDDADPPLVMLSESLTFCVLRPIIKPMAPTMAARDAVSICDFIFDDELRAG